LTGLHVDDPATLQRRPLAIKVSNFPVQGRPHSGLSFADLVFEYYIGEGMTRFLAVYLGQDSPEVGPIRSGRLIDGQLGRMYGAALGMKGADAFVYDVLEERLPGLVFNASPSLCPALCPYTTAYTYGTFGDSAAFTRILESRDMNQPLPSTSELLFSEEPPAGGESGQQLQLYYSYLNQVAWDYDDGQGAYLRSQDNADAVLAPITDKVNGSRITFDNVVVILAEHDYLSPTLIEVELWEESGPALLLRDGRAYSVQWISASQDEPLRLVDEADVPIPLKSGSTWIEILSLKSELDRTEPGRWWARFH
jgi:hypothetical protein